MIAKRLLGIQKAISPPAPAATDVYYDYRSLILNMQGSAGSTTFTDSSPNNFAITAYGNAQLVADATFGAVASFDGSTYLLGNSGIPFSFGTGDFTVEYWFNASSLPPLYNYRGICGNADNSTTMGFGISSPSSNNYRIGATTQAIAYIGNTNIAANIWYHAAFVRQSGILKLYLNGVLDGTHTVVANLTNTQFYIINPNAAYRFKGLIGPLRVSPWAVYKSNFTPSQDLYPAVQDSTYANPYYDKVALQLKFDGTNGSTSFVDSGPNALAVTPYGNAQITSASKYGSGAGTFDGTNSHLQLGAQASLNFGTSDFTIEGWFYLSSKTNRRQGLIANSQASWSSGVAIIKAYDADTSPFNRITFQCYDYSSNGVPIVYSSTIPSTSSWYHVAVTRSGNTFRLFVNGILESSNTFTGNINLNGGNKTYVGYSSYDGANGYFNGSIDELEVTPGVAKYKANFTPPVRGLSTIYNPYTTLPVSGAALWLDGADSSTLFTDAGVTPVNKSGDLVYQWSDKSGNNRHATQATSGNRPTWLPPASGQNGFGVVGFNGATTFLSIADTAGLQFGTGDFTLFFAGVNSNVSRGSAYANTFISKGYTNIEFYQYQGLIQGYIGGTSNSPKTGSGTVSNNSSYVAHMIRSSGSTYVAANNVSGTPVTNTANANGSGTNINIGSRSPFNTTLTYLGSMYEILAFNRALSPTEITSVQSYLKAKWGTP